VTELVRAAALLRIPDALSRGPRQPADVALEVSADAGLLQPLMRALAGLGVLEELEDGTFSNTELGSLLREHLGRVVVTSPTSTVIARRLS
jgi:hypothetical protein